MDITIATLVVLVLSGVILPLIRHWGERYLFDSEDFTKNLNKSIHINDKLREIRHKCQASRIFIMQFHNGGRFYNNRRRQKMSMLDEAYGSSQKGLLNSFQDLPINYMAETVERTQQHGVFIVESLNQINNSTERSLLIDNKVASLKCIAIYKRMLTSRRVLGFIPMIQSQSQMIATVHIWLESPYSQHDAQLTSDDHIIIERAIEEITRNLI